MQICQGEPPRLQPESRLEHGKGRGKMVYRGCTGRLFPVVGKRLQRGNGNELEQKTVSGVQQHISQGGVRIRFGIMKI